MVGDRPVIAVKGQDQGLEPGPVQERGQLPKGTRDCGVQVSEHPDLDGHKSRLGLDPEVDLPAVAGARRVEMRSPRGVADFFVKGPAGPETSV